MKLQLSICTLLLIALASASAQVASHEPPNKPLTRVVASEKPVVKVNQAVLTERDLVREMYTIFPYARVHNGFPKEQEAQIRKGALDMILFEELVYQDAMRRGAVVSASRVDSGLKSYQQVFKSRAEFDAYLKDECQGSMQILRQRVKRSLLIDDALKSQVESKSVVTDVELRAFYAKNPDKFTRPEMFDIQSISIMTDPKKEQPLEAKKRAEDAARKAKATKSAEEFGMLAEKVSDDDFRVNMGKHKPVGKADLPPTVIDALKTMKAGDVSGLIPVENSYTIVRLIAHNLGGQVPYSAVKPKLKENMTAMKKEQLRSALSKRLRASATVVIL